MNYQERLRELRGAKSRATLVADSGLELTTIIKAETVGRPVKFATVASIVRALGYSDDSEVMREIALLWLESISGVRFSFSDAYAEFQRLLKRDRIHLQDMLDRLGDVLSQNGRVPSDVDLLCWAAQSDPALEILRAARGLADGSSSQESKDSTSSGLASIVQQRGGLASGHKTTLFPIEDNPAFRVAETSADAAVKKSEAPQPRRSRSAAPVPKPGATG